MHILEVAQDSENLVYWPALPVRNFRNSLCQSRCVNMRHRIYL